MAAPIQNSNWGSNGRPHGRGSAILALALGLLSVASLPVAVAVTRRRDDELMDAGWMIPAALVLGLAAVWLARRSRKRLQRAVTTSSRGRTARLGRALGLAGFLIAVTGALAVGVSLLLDSVAD